MIRLSDSCPGSESVVRSDRVNDSRGSGLSWWWLIADQLVCQMMEREVRVDEPVQPVCADVYQDHPALWHEVVPDYRQTMAGHRPNGSMIIQMREAANAIG